MLPNQLIRTLTIIHLSCRKQFHITRGDNHACQVKLDSKLVNRIGQSNHLDPNPICVIKHT